MFWSTATFQRKIVRRMMMTKMTTMTKTVVMMMLTTMKTKGGQRNRPLSQAFASTRSSVISKESRREICLFRWSTSRFRDVYVSNMRGSVRWLKLEARGQLKLQPKHSSSFCPQPTPQLLKAASRNLLAVFTVGRLKFTSLPLSGQVFHWNLDPGSLKG